MNGDTEWRQLAMKQLQAIADDPEANEDCELQAAVDSDSDDDKSVEDAPEVNFIPFSRMSRTRWIPGSSSHAPAAQANSPSRGPSASSTHQRLSRARARRKSDAYMTNSPEFVAARANKVPSSTPRERGETTVQERSQRRWSVAGPRIGKSHNT